MLSKFLFAVLAVAATVVLAKGASRFTYYDMFTPASLPCDTVEGPDGAVWVEELSGNKLARIDPETGNVTEYDIPFTLPKLNITLPGMDRVALSCAFANGFDGKLYASNGLRNQLVQMDVHTKEIRLFTAPNHRLGNLQPLNDMTAAPDGIYFTSTTANTISRFHYATEKFEVIDIPTPLSDPLGIYYATNGFIYYCGLLSNKIGRLNRHTKIIEEFDLPLSLAGPVVMRAELKNRYLYFASVVGNSIGEIDTETNRIRAFPIPKPLSTPVEVCPSRSGDIWFTHILENSLGRLNPSTGTFEEITLPETKDPGLTVSLPLYVGSGIYCEPLNSIWATEATRNRAYRYQLE